MNSGEIPYSVPIGLGLIAGLITVTLFGGWIRVVLFLRNEPRRMEGGTLRPQRRLLGVPLLALLNPIPWVYFVGLPAAAFYFVVVRRSSLATIFFGVLGLVVALSWAASFLLYRRALKLRKQRDS